MRRWIGLITQDVQYAVRMSRRQLMFTAVAVGTLALGIGANTAIFSVVDHVVFRPLRFAEPERLLVIHELVPASGRTSQVPVKLTHFEEWRRSVRAFDGFVLFAGARLTLMGTGDPERLSAARVSANLFPLLGVQPQLGRSFANDEEQPGRDHVVLLSDDLWRGRFAADPTVVGRTITLDGELYQVVGVLPASFTFPRLSDLYPNDIDASDAPRIWKPFAPSPAELDPRAGYNYASLARLAPGVSASQALAELNAAQAGLSPGKQGREQLQAAVVPLLRQITGRSRAGLTLLLVAVGAVLLIGCVNISNLLLARTIGRRRELALRAALGASRGRLVSQLLVETLVLSVVGGALGILIAYQTIRLIVAAAPADLPRLAEVSLDGRILLFTAAASLLSGLLVGILPAWRMTHGDSVEALKVGPASSPSTYATKHMRSFLVSLEVGLSAMCLMTGGLLLASLNQLLAVDVGFEAQQVVTVNVSPAFQRYPTPESRVIFVQTLLQGVGRIPNVTAAGISNQLPLTGEGGNALITAEGVTMQERPLADLRVVSPGYLRAMGIPMRTGRLFTEADRDRSVAMISSLTADRLWPEQNPLGKRFRFGPPTNPAIEVVGVVGDVRGVSLDRKPSFTIYLPYWQPIGPRAPRSFDVSLVVRTAGDPPVVFPGIRRVIREMDSDLPLTAFRTMNRVIEESVGQRRFTTTLVLLFALAATLLASLGIYGVVSYSVAQRTHEMGIRLALGGRPGQIRRLVMLQSLASVAVGLVAGLVIASLGLHRVLGAMLFGIRPTDPWMLATVAAVILGVGVLATHVPAHRATRVDPLRSLRQD